MRFKTLQGLLPEQTMASAKIKLPSALYWTWADCAIVCRNLKHSSYDLLSYVAWFYSSTCTTFITVKKQSVKFTFKNDNFLSFASLLECIFSSTLSV